MIKKTAKILKVSLKISTKPLIISAGMPRSGSTLLFNILREILRVKYQGKLSSGWTGDIMLLPKGSAYLVKTHKIDRFYRLRAQHSFYTFRDVRVAAVSAMRKFNSQPTLDSIRAKIAQYRIAKEACDAVFRYEDLIAEPLAPMETMAQTLRVQIDPQAIMEKVSNLRPPEEEDLTYSPDTLLHKDHCTHTKDDEWRHILPKELQGRINKEFNGWFKECGYPES